jgi:hypothetical protein
MILIGSPHPALSPNTPLIPPLRGDSWGVSSSRDRVGVRGLTGVKTSMGPFDKTRIPPYELYGSERTTFFDSGARECIF